MIHGKSALRVCKIPFQVTSSCTSRSASLKISSWFLRKNNKIGFWSIHKRNATITRFVRSVSVESSKQLWGNDCVLGLITKLVKYRYSLVQNIMSHSESSSWPFGVSRKEFITWHQLTVVESWMSPSPFISHYIKKKSHLRHFISLSPSLTHYFSS